MTERALHDHRTRGARASVAFVLCGLCGLCGLATGCTTGTIDDEGALRAGAAGALGGGPTGGPGHPHAGTSGVLADGGLTSAPFVPAVASLRRLTVAQYENTVQALFPAAVQLPAELELEPDSAVNGFYSIGAAKATLGPSATEKFETAAYALSAQALSAAQRDAIVPCTPSGVVDTDCTTRFVRDFGRRVFRRPLQADEIARYVALAEDAASTLDDFHQGLEFALAGLLQSPHFLFRTELGQVDPQDPTRRRYDDYEMATRLSFFLWNGPPDDALLDAAERGELSTPEGLKAQASRLLADPRARPALDNFHSERLGLDALDTLEKDASLTPTLDDGLRAAMRDDMLKTIEELTLGDAASDFRALFDTRLSFVNAGLAQIYALPAPSTSPARVLLPADAPRLGIIGKAATLALGAHTLQTSPTLRGKFIRERVLCESIPAPPPNVVTVLPEPNPSAPTMRDRLAQHASSDGCKSCHTRMDPLGLSLEHFDALGRYRQDDDGHALDTTGTLDGTDFDGARELATVLRDDPRTVSCIARQAYRYAVAHVEAAGEEPAIAALLQAFSDSGHRFEALVHAVVVSDGFRYAAIGE